MKRHESGHPFRNMNAWIGTCNSIRNIHFDVVGDHYFNFIVVVLLWLNGGGGGSGQTLCSYGERSELTRAKRAKRAKASGCERTCT